MLRQRHIHWSGNPLSADKSSKILQVEQGFTHLQNGARKEGLA